jgi:hypothetical protein
MARLAACVLVTLATALAAAAPASASLSDEVGAGQALAQQLQAGTTSCDRLAPADFEHLGEYVMGRAVGSVQLHEAMNARMRSAMGAENEERMHVLLGQRYAGCGAGPMMGAGWQHMSRADWERVSDQWIGPGMMRTAGTGWHTGDYVLLGGSLLLIVVLGGAVLAWRPWRRRGDAAPVR